MNRIGFAANFRDSRANPNATWNENFIQHCKMQEAAKPSKRILLRPNARASGPVFWRRTRRATLRRRVGARLIGRAGASPAGGKKRLFAPDAAGMALAICEQCDCDEEEADAQPASNTTYIGKH